MHAATYLALAVPTTDTHIHTLLFYRRAPLVTRLFRQDFAGTCTVVVHGMALEFVLSAFVTARMYLCLMYITVSLYIAASLALHTRPLSHSSAAAERHALFYNLLLSTVHRQATER